MYRPILGLSVFMTSRVMSETYLLNHFSSFPVSILSLYGAIIIILFLISMLAKNNFTLLMPEIRYYLLFILISLLSFIPSINHLNSLVFLAKLTSLFAVYALFYNYIRTQGDAIKALNYFVLFSIFPVLYGFIQYLLGDYMVSQVHVGEVFNKMYSTFSHPNQFAFFLSVVFLGIKTISQIRQNATFRYHILMVMVLLSIILTFSRSVWLTLFFIIVISLVLTKRHRFPIIIILSLIFVISFSLIASRFDELNNPDHKGRTSLDFRVNLSKDLLTKAFPNSPYFGYGIGNAELVADRYSNYGPVAAHNDYARLLIESGVVGLVTFCFFLFSCYLFVLRNYIYIFMNPYLLHYLLLVLFITIVIVGSNHLGSLSTLGIAFWLMAILRKGYYLEKHQMAVS